MQDISPSAEAIDVFQQHAPQVDAERVAKHLNQGMTQLRDLLLQRVHEDVERYFQVDSMVAPGSVLEAKRQTRKATLEIEIYSVIVVDDEIAHGGYLPNSKKWFLDWLFELRLGGNHQDLIKRRVEFYKSYTVEQRRLKFLTMLQKALPESAQTPLVLFRMFPRAVRIAAALAFDDLKRAKEIRAEQCSFLPAAKDCLECRGTVLTDHRSCSHCGNPVWDFKWLQAD